MRSSALHLPMPVAVALAALASSFAMKSSAAESSEPSPPELRRVSYHSTATGAERDYFVYLPRGYNLQASWPVILFLHGNGERGDGKADLPYVLKHGPLFEAWAQKKDLPFIIISPQLPVYSMGNDTTIKNRKPEDVPQRTPGGTHPYPPHYDGHEPMQGALSDANLPQGPEGPRDGWNKLEDDLLGIIDHATKNLKGDPKRVYLTGLSYGGYGTWYMAAKHPDKFAAIAPVVGYGHPDHAPAIAAAKLPLWVFAGGRDDGVPVKYFYPVLNKLEALGHPDVRFTIEADMGHPTWVRVYASQDLYTWFLSHSK